MEFGDALTLQNALCDAVKEVGKAGKKTTAAPKAPANAAVKTRRQGNPGVNGVSIVHPQWDLCDCWHVGGRLRLPGAAAGHHGREGEERLGRLFRVGGLG